MTTVIAPVSTVGVPQQLEDTGLSGDLVLQLVTKMLAQSGELTGEELAVRLGVTFGVIEPALMVLKRDRHVDIAGGSVLGPPSYVYRLTDAGRMRAALFLQASQYVGPLPVPLQQYTAYMTAFARNQQVVATRDVVAKAFGHLVLSRRMLDQLGPALAAWHSLFIYGPPGNGKSVISQAIRNVLAGDLLVPHAIAVDDHIIRVFDPVNHEPIVSPPDSPHGFHRRHTDDARWVRCRRPLVTAGGEMALESLELGYSRTGGFYRAPLQVLANGGVLVIDDFGRQQVSPASLLNRWIVPLESRVDYLTLQTGQKFEIPFATLVVFATNLNPSDLVDEAFLRRIRYKVLAESPTVEEFIQIFQNYCRDRQLGGDAGAVLHLIDRELRPRGIALRGCYPRDLIEHALAIASYLDRPRRLTAELLSEACASYFVDDSGAPVA